MTKRILAIAGIAVLVIGATVFALGHAVQGDGRGHGRGGRRGPFGPEMIEHMSRELNLTDAQKTQVKTVLDEAMTGEDARRAKDEELHKQLESITANGQFDETQVRNIANQQGALMADRIVEHERIKSKIFAVLTPEQRTKAEELHKRGGGHGPRHGPPPPPRGDQ